MIEETIVNLRTRIEHLEIIEKTLHTFGSWTPEFTGDAGAGTFTYIADGQVGRYVRLGNTVFIWGFIAISAITVAPMGFMRIYALPLNSATGSNVRGSVSFGEISNFNYSATALALTGYIPPNMNYIQLSESFDNAIAADVPAANFTNVNVALTFAGQYQV